MQILGTKYETKYVPIYVVVSEYLCSNKYHDINRATWCIE